jgi:selenium metabolism protein YedF
MRRKDREITEFPEIVAVMEACEVCHVAFLDEEYPYVVPMNFGFEARGEDLTLYFHGAAEGKKHDLIKKNNKVAFVMECAHWVATGPQAGACESTMPFECVMGTGIISYVEEENKTAALQYILNHYKISEGKNPFHTERISKTTVLKIDVTSLSGKKLVIRRELNLAGLVCPQPVLACRTLLDREEVQELVAYVDNEAADANVRRFLEQRGFRTTTEKKGETWRIAAVREGAAQQSDTRVPQGAEKKILVFITTETLGRGDDGLGAKLMATFLATLPEMGDALWRVILLNGGVKLAAAPGDALQSLHALEQSGVSVLVCGTCLAHYGLNAQKSVGETSNMLDIVTSLSLADLVIRP